MLGGLAAGLGLAWLASSLGMGEAFANILMIALLGVVIMGVIGWVMRSRRSAASSPGGLAYQGAGPAAMPGAYSPNNVGNDASARPWERNGMAFDASRQQQGTGSLIGSGLSGSQNWGIPEGFDAEGFLTAAKRNFVTLQSAWDRSDITTLRSMMTDDMLTEVRHQLAERQPGAPANVTHVEGLEAQLLGIEDLGDAYMASVEFSGMVREEQGAGLSPMREVWNMTKPKNGTSGWLVAGLQALQ